MNGTGTIRTGTIRTGTVRLGLATAALLAGFAGPAAGDFEHTLTTADQATVRLDQTTNGFNTFINIDFHPSYDPPPLMLTGGGPAAGEVMEAHGLTEFDSSTLAGLTITAASLRLDPQNVYTGDPTRSMTFGIAGLTPITGTLEPIEFYSTSNLVGTLGIPGPAPGVAPVVDVTAFLQSAAASRSPYVEFIIFLKDAVNTTGYQFPHAATLDVTATTDFATPPPLPLSLQVLPEPGSLALLGIGAAGLLGVAARRRKARRPA